DHDGARIAERVGLLEEFDAFGAQFIDPGVEIADAQRYVVLQLPARPGEGPVALVGVPHHRYVAEFDTGPRRTEHPFEIERRPGAIGSAPGLVGSFSGRIARPHRSIEMLLIPAERADRIFLVEMYVVEALGRVVPGIFNESVVGSPHIGEPAAARRLGAFGS